MKKVNISDKSLLYLYNEDHHYSTAKSYSSTEKQRLAQDTLREVLRLKNRLNSRKKSYLDFADRLKECGISQDEILGLEQIVLEDPKSTQMRRKVHVRAVLLEQAIHSMEGTHDKGRLARMSILSSESSVSQARSRAAKAA